MPRKKPAATPPQPCAICAQPCDASAEVISVVIGGDVAHLRCREKASAKP